MTPQSTWRLVATRVLEFCVVCVCTTGIMDMKVTPILIFAPYLIFI